MSRSKIQNPKSKIQNLNMARSTNPQPRISLFTMFQLGLFQMGLGMMSLLTLGILNRIMIKELAIPAVIAAGAIAVHQFMSPARLWFGQLSDAKPLFGYHRSGYVWIGAALFSLTAFLAVQVMWQLGASVQTVGWAFQTQLWVVALSAVFAFYGLALSASSTPFAALLVDVSEDDERSKLVGIVWSMLMVGIVIGAILSARLLPSGETVVQDLATLKPAVNRLFIVVPAIVFALGVIATFGVEKKYSRYASRSVFTEREDQITLGRAIQVLTASPQTGLFFSFLLAMTISLFMQDAVMESFGGQVFGMTVSETTRLNAFWGMGTLIGISTAGFAIVPRLGKARTAKLGCLLVASCLCFLILTGFIANPKLLQSGLFLFGLASGVTTTGAISLMLDLTAAETAGTFIGAWGLAQALARAAATVLGGGILDLGKGFLPNLASAYGLVFGLQALGMVVAVALLSRVDVKAFQTNTKAAISTILQGELD
jgi:BCD family chlorophyll transporter-like MFS transporter